jgi:hypothetical protein
MSEPQPAAPAVAVWQPAKPGETPGQLTPQLTQIRCTCRAGDGGLHGICCLVSAATQPHAMVDADGAVFYPDNLDDARHFADGYGAWMLNPSAGAAWLVSEGDPSPSGTHTPGGPVRPSAGHLPGGRGRLDGEAAA